MQLTNAEIKLIRSLSEKKYRDKLSLFVVEGEKMLGEALASGYEPVSIWRRDMIGDAAMARISSLSSPSPVLAVLRKKETLPDTAAPGLYLALDGVRDPGNMGTIIRAADWFGVKAVFASPDSVELYNPKVIQSTMGSLFRCNFAYTDIPGLCRNFRSGGREVYGTFLDGDDIYSTPLSSDALIVMGNESHGISDACAAGVSRRILIPKAAGSAAESLNVAVATAVCLSQFCRPK